MLVAQCFNALTGLLPAPYGVSSAKGVKLAQAALGAGCMQSLWCKLQHALCMYYSPTFCDSQVAAFVLRTLLAGDTSKWTDAIRREHYNPAGMPVVTWKILLQLLQQINSRKFTRFDYGKERNVEVYGGRRPLDVATLYDLLDFRIDFVAGGSDSIVSAKAVQKHVNAVVKANELRTSRGEAPIEWTYKVLPGLGHLSIIDGDNAPAVQCLRQCWQTNFTS